MKRERFLLALVLVFALAVPSIAGASFALYAGQGSVYDSSAGRDRAVAISVEIDHFLNSYNGGQWNEYNVLNWSINVQDLMSVSGNGGFFGFAVKSGPYPIYSQDWMFLPFPVTASNGTTWEFSGAYEFINTKDYFHLPYKITLAGVFDGSNGLDMDQPFYLDRVHAPVPAALILFGSGLCGLIGLKRKFFR